MADAFVFDHVRTPRGRGKKDGALHAVSTVELAAQALRALTERNGIDAGVVGDVILGCVDPVGEAGGDVAKSAAVAAGFPYTVPGMQVNRYCASGLDAVNIGSAAVRSGAHDLVIAGGVESMSRVGIGASGGAWPVDPRVALPSYFLPQGVSADLIATRYGFTRADVDAYAVASQMRATIAWDEGRFAGSVVPVRDVNGVPMLDRDEHIRPDTSMQGLAALAPSFAMFGEMGGFDAVAIDAHPEVEAVEHVHTAGNSSGIVDGAAAVLVGSADAGVRLGLRPRARIRAYANIGSEPALMLTGPVDVTRLLLARTGMALSDIDLFEVNEAFAAVVLRYLQAFELDPAVVNVNGGAIAMGHPLGATGAMLLGTALDELERRDLSTALVTLCIGAGMGTATIIERV
jgi:acetyl-CoA C-acetyltransferase